MNELEKKLYKILRGRYEHKTDDGILLSHADVMCHRITDALILDESMPELTIDSVATVINEDLTDKKNFSKPVDWANTVTAVKYSPHVSITWGSLGAFEVIREAIRRAVEEDDMTWLQAIRVLQHYMWFPGRTGEPESTNKTILEATGFAEAVGFIEIKE